MRCTGFDCATGEARFEDGSTIAGHTLIATDGGGSAVRESMAEQIEGFELSQGFLEHGYKELHIPPATDGVSLLDRNALHIWPRHQFMMIALPNFDGSFTCTLFLAQTSSPPYEGGVAGPTKVGADGVVPSVGFDQLNEPPALRDFFNREFSDAVPLMPTLVDDFFHNPTGLLGTIKCWPWNVSGKALLLGDSAHAMVPFYGQGMNCAFEDVRVVDSLIEKHGADWEAVYHEYGQLRKVNADAICDMAQENFYEMRDATADPVFQRKRELETKLEQTYPDYFSKYSMVTFREDLPYSVAKQKGNAQDRLLMEICSTVDDVSELDLEQVHKKISDL
jgi:kynurenine 3-monooxygenase